MFDVIGKRNWFFLFSGLILVPGLIFILLTPATNGEVGLKFSVDYTGGTVWQLQFKNPNASIDEVRAVLVQQGIGDAEVSEDSVHNITIRTKRADLIPPPTAQPILTAAPSSSAGASAGASGEPRSEHESRPQREPRPERERSPRARARLRAPLRARALQRVRRPRRRPLPTASIRPARHAPCTFRPAEPWRRLPRLSRPTPSSVRSPAPACRAPSARSSAPS